jgi:hypothetical protein
MKIRGLPGPSRARGVGPGQSSSAKAANNKIIGGTLKEYRPQHLDDGKQGPGFYPMRKLNGVEVAMDQLRFNDYATCKTFCDDMHRTQQKYDGTRKSGTRVTAQRG